MGVGFQQDLSGPMWCSFSYYDRAISNIMPKQQNFTSMGVAAEFIYTVVITCLTPQPGDAVHGIKRIWCCFGPRPLRQHQPNPGRKPRHLNPHPGISFWWEPHQTYPRMAFREHREAGTVQHRDVHRGLQSSAQLLWLQVSSHCIV